MSNILFNLSKSNCERYSFRFNDGWDYAFFILDETGLLLCESSFGTYGYSWSSFGTSFKNFLCQLNSGYLLSKISSCQTFNLENYLNHVFKTILKNRKDGEYSKEDARLLWNFFKEDFEQVDSYEATILQLTNTSVFDQIGLELFYSDFNPEYTYPEEAIVFANKIFPMLQSVLKEELGIEN